MNHSTAKEGAPHLFRGCVPGGRRAGAPADGCRVGGALSKASGAAYLAESVLLEVPPPNDRKVRRLEAVVFLRAPLQRARHAVAHVEIGHAHFRRQTQLEHKTE